MAKSKLTMLGYQAYLKHEGDDLFSMLVVPDGIDRDVLINNILLEGGEFEVVYGNPEFMRYAIDIWSKKWYRTFEKWVNALDLEYNPIENYDRIEEYTDDSINDGSSSGTSTVNDKTSNVNKITAFDSDAFRNSDSTDSNVDSKGTSTNTNHATNKFTHKGRYHGNIGVTTSQQMLQSELDIAKWNLYEHITDLFLKEFCVLVYE